jgi:patatin-like phospholipase/acyl hydrolase
VVDGGGVRGVSELEILKELFHGREDIQPYKYFDMMCGTSTGGYVMRILYFLFRRSNGFLD